MNSKFYNDAIIGNKNMVVSFSNNGELLRLYFQSRDYKQFVDISYAGVKINDSAIIYLHDDINNTYNQNYTENTNILNTKIYNSYFKLSIMQTDFVAIDKNILIKKYKFKNDNNINLNVDFLLYSKLLSNTNNMVGSKIENDILMQYTHDYTYCVFSKNKIKGHRLNNSINDIRSGVISDKDYIGMAEDSAISYEIGQLLPGEEKEIDVIIYINDNNKVCNFDKIIEEIENIKKIDTKNELQKTKLFWEEYVIKHDGLKLLNSCKQDIKNIYVRTILLFYLLVNHDTGGISAAIELDEYRQRSGRYSYCWTRDAVFVTKALDILNMHEEAEKFYLNFAKDTQSKNGMWEQRFYTDGRLAPCWGYQIDETASIVYGVYTHYLSVKNEQFLKETFEMCNKAIEYLKMYVDFVTGKKTFGNNMRFETSQSYDLWEMNEGIHLYSLASIYSAFNSMQNIIKICEKIEENENIKELEKYKEEVKKYCLENLCDKQINVLKRNNKDNVMDISILGSITPFEMFSIDEKIVKNTIEKMDLTIKTYTGGYLRFENDGYIEGKNPWVIATLWMTLYNFKNENIEEAKKQIEFITKTATKHGYLAEQIDNEKMTAKWIIGLGWSHAMYIIALDFLANFDGIL